MSTLRALTATMFLLSFSLVLLELLLTRLFAVALFASFAHLALGLAMLGISAGAVLQHVWPGIIPERHPERRLGQVALAQALVSLLAAAAVLNFPLTAQFAEAPSGFGERSSLSWDLVNTGWFTALLPLLTLPFTLAGLAFAGAFQRFKEHIGRLYAADLIGGALGALAFLPLLAIWPAPDAVLAVVAACAGAGLGLARAAGDRLGALLSGLALAAAALGLGVSATGTELLHVRAAAGFSEENVTYAEWTPLTRLAVHEDGQATTLLLDNTSASEVILTRRARARKAREANRSVVYRLHDPPARVAILAASAGPEVAVAQHYGYQDIDAIDIAAAPELVWRRWPDAAANPFRQPGVRRVVADGRAAILHAEQRYDIIQMVHANLHSSAGLLANAWSPSLIETREAFGTYLDQLEPEGTLSFGRGSSTRHLLRSALAALEARGVAEPQRQVAYVEGSATIMLIKRRPFTAEEVQKLEGILATYPRQSLAWDPTTADRDAPRRITRNAALITDDRPYIDTPEQARAGLVEGLRRLTGGSDQVGPIALIHHTLAIQGVFVLLAGALLLGVPLATRSRAGLAEVGGVAPGLLYVAGLGYGYLAVETVLIHELVLFVGHPTYAITAVLLTMLLCSGLGSAWVQRREASSLEGTLKWTLGAVLVLGAVQAFLVPPALTATALGLPMAARVALTAALLAPLGFVMGTPFPLAMRILRPEAAGLVPWAWAINGWTSVLASLGTVLLSRLWGYSLASAVALAAYALALACAGRLSRIGLSGDPSLGGR
ncbi:MAG: hypothetical protein H6741_19385 [Alphaproteobacteria bacterium]|nr:hypothetical protein [Alphaproteobacteria bacterium]